MTQSPTAPVAPDARLDYPDVLRGVALLGIFPVNLPVLALPMVYAMESAPMTGGWLEAATVALSRMAFDQKFITLFSLLFGVGLGLQHARLVARGERWGRFITRRLGVLFVFGFLHALLLFWGDILATYALIGLLCAPAVRLGAFAQRVLAAVLIAVPGLGMLAAVPLMFALDAALGDLSLDAGAPAYTPGLASGSWSELLEGMAAWGPEFERELQVDAPLVRPMLLRLLIWGAMQLSLPFGYGPRIAGLFVLGIAIAQDGRLLRPAEHPALFRRLVWCGLAVGVPLQLLAGAAVLYGGGLGPLMAVEALLYLGSLGLAAAYAGAVGLLVAYVRPSRLEPLRALGRAALSGYLLQSVLASFLFAGWGLGWFGTLHRGQLWLVIPVVWVTSLALATLWMRDFPQGPAEALWRRLTYGRAASGPEAG